MRRGEREKGKERCESGGGGKENTRMHQNWLLQKDIFLQMDLEWMNHFTQYKLLLKQQVTNKKANSFALSFPTSSQSKIAPFLPQHESLLLLLLWRATSTERRALFPSRLSRLQVKGTRFHVWKGGKRRTKRVRSPFFLFKISSFSLVKLPPFEPVPC